MALRAVTQFGFFYQFLNYYLKKNMKICEKSVATYPKIYHSLSNDLQKDKTIILRALKSKLQINIPNELISDKQIMKLYLRDHFEISHIDPHILKELLDDRQVALEAIRRYSKRVRDISERLQYDISFFYKAVTRNYFSYCEFPKQVKENREIVKKLVKMNLPLFLLSNDFRKDEEIVRECIVKNFRSIKYADASVISKEFLLSLLLDKKVYIHWELFQMIPEYLVSDLDIIRAVSKIGSKFYEYLKTEQKTREVTEIFLSDESKSSKWYCMLNDLPPELLKDRELVIRCIQKQSQIFSLPEMYKSDKEIVILSAHKWVKEYLLYTDFMDNELLLDVEFMRELLEKVPELVENRNFNFGK